MTTGSRPQARILIMALLIALICVLLGQLVEIRYGLNIWDEGFLWYGVQRIWAGEVPIRDFMAYDPGRYYWTAGVASLWGGRAILDVRVAVAVFQWIGMAVGVLLLAQATRGRQVLWLLLAAATLWVWMFPRHKLFDISLSIMLVGLIAWWLERPDPTRYFWIGVGLGLVACFGRNHGIYGLVGCALAIAWMAIDKQSLPAWRSLAAWLVGTLVGFMPLLIACLLVPGFAIAFWNSIAFLFEVKTTNLPLPIPWPWRVDFAVLSWSESARRILVGLCFIGLLVYPIVGAIALWRRRTRGGQVTPALVATVCISLPYAHYAFSRADVGHLAQSIFPAMLGCIMLLLGVPSLKRKLGLAGMAVASAWIAWPFHPNIPCLLSRQCAIVDIGGNRLILDPSVASDVALISNLADEYAPNGRAFVTTPYWPGAYALMHRRSPLWEIYATPPRSEQFQQQEIARLAAARPGFILIFDFPLDNREELRYRNTHPLILKYVEDHFQRVSSANPNYLIFRAP